MAKRQKIYTPERQLDEVLLRDGMYNIMVYVILFLFVGVSFFVGIMPIELSVSLAGIFTLTITAVVLSPLLYERRGSYQVRRIQLCNFFPVSRKEFLRSKCAILFRYVMIFWLASAAAQLLAVPFWNLERALLYQLMLLVCPVLWGGLLLLLGTYQ